MFAFSQIICSHFLYVWTWFVWNKENSTTHSQITIELGIDHFIAIVENGLTIVYYVHLSWVTNIICYCRWFVCACVFVHVAVVVILYALIYCMKLSPSSASTTTTSWAHITHFAFEKLVFQTCHTYLLQTSTRQTSITTTTYLCTIYTERENIMSDLRYASSSNANQNKHRCWIRLEN